MLPIVDVENAENAGVTKAEVEACVTAFAARVKERTNRPVMLYARTLLRDLSITSHMGCDALWAIDLNAHLNREPAPGWTIAQANLWQYVEDGTGNLEGAPKEVPGVGPVDLNIYIDGANPSTLVSLRARLINAKL